MFGYRWVFNYLQQQSDKRLEASLDRNEYNEADLITITVPISLPYINNQQDFERVDGEITVEGKIYKYVKRKIADGNLVLLCLPDYNKMKIESAKDDFFKYANDLAQNNQSKKSDNSKSGVFKNLVSEFVEFTSYFTPACFPVKHIHTNCMQPNFYASSPHTTPEQPPEWL